MNTIETIETIKCQCGTTFQWDSGEKEDFWRDIARPTYCVPCNAIVEAERERIHMENCKQEAAKKLATAQESTMKRIQEITPPRYQRTDINHPAFNRDLWKKVNSWNPTDDVPFLGLIGDSGTCKTRIGFMRFSAMVKGMVVASGFDGAVYIPRFYAMTSPDFAQLVGRQFMNSSGGRGSWDNDPKQDARRQLDKLRDCDVLFLDDLGKAKNTDTVAAELWAVINHRHAHDLATIWTANSNPEVIVNDMSEDRAGSLAGRLIECSEIITI